MSKTYVPKSERSSFCRDGLRCIYRECREGYCAQYDTEPAVEEIIVLPSSGPDFDWSGLRANRDPVFNDSGDPT